MRMVFFAFNVIITIYFALALYFVRLDFYMNFQYLKMSVFLYVID